MTCKDRLPELRRIASSAAARTESEPLDVEGGETLPPPAQHQQIQEIIIEVEKTRAWINDIIQNTLHIRRLHSDPTYHTNTVLQERVDSLITASNATGLKVCGALRQLEERCKSAGSAAAGRITRLQYAVTRRLYADALEDHHRVLQLLRDHQLRLLHDQIKLTNLSITDEECERLLDSNNISFFVDNVEAETSQARLALREAEVRRDDLARVEAALQNVRDLFLNLAHLVAAQQEQVDSVEYYALQATERVEYGGQELLKGTVSRRKAKKKKLGLILCLTSGFLIVLLVLIYT
ncbi:unnamed protein product [Pieris brassicae]|uniref:t-SNARE coiled-coil homology domain-containing protein n=1 Tax=Pieris brassicae TaxID=7116 RepID=A0A9P0XAQ8_PIEBR|nr:unnamed protein product [Pieris brassicae]